MRALALLVLLAGCAQPHVGVARAALTGPSDCINPAAYGAAPGDSKDDAPAIQKAIDEATSRPDGGTVCLGPGRWTGVRALPGTYDRFAVIHVRGRHVTLRGAGPETVLEVTGDQGSSTTILVDVLPGADGVVVADLTLDLSGTTNTAEQTHAIATSGTCANETCMPISNLQVSGVTFRHPRNTESRKGDCIRLIGNSEATRLYGVRIVGNDFAQCARSAIELQRGVFDVAIVGNTISAVKTCIDGEATGEGLGTDARLTVTGNVFKPGCTPSLSLTSYTGATIIGNAIGSITSYRSTQVLISGNTVVHQATESTGTIYAANACDGLAITGNSVVRTGTPGPVIELEPHSGTTCSGVAVTGNTLSQGTKEHGVSLISVSRATISGNAIMFTGEAPGYSGIYERSVLAAAPVTAVSITGNLVAGSVTYGVTLQAHPAQFGAGILVANNAAVGPVFGLRCQDQLFTATVTASGNAWPPGSWPSASVTGGVP